MFWKSIVVFALLFISGCSTDNQIPENVLVKARASYEEGVLLVKQKDYEAAIPRLTDAINNGALANTEIVNSLLMRAKSYLFTQNSNLALEDINTVMRGVEETAQIAEAHAMKSLYLKKSGELPKADAEFQKAQSIDPNVKAVTQ